MRLSPIRIDRGEYMWYLVLISIGLFIIQMVGGEGESPHLTQLYELLYLIITVHSLSVASASVGCQGN
jgi:hypothetical protein